jgi:hypothetical protein
MTKKKPTSGSTVTNVEAVRAAAPPPTTGCSRSAF